MSNTQKAIAITALVSALGAAFVWNQRARQEHLNARPAKAARDDTQSEFRLLNEKIARLEEATALQAAALSQAAAQAKTESPLPAQSAAPKAGDSTPPGEHAPTEAEATAQLEDKFQAEPSDPNWSGGAVTQATRALAGDLPRGSSLGAVECRTNLCRVESTHDNLDAFKSFVESTLLKRDKKLWNGGFSAQVVSQSQSGVKAVTFIAREGQSVPAAEPVPD